MSMSKNITDIANWENEFPFLKEVWEFHNTLDALEDTDKYNSNIQSFCHMVLRKINKDVGEYNSFCSKLLKNLGLYSENAEFYIRSNDRCNILYNWVYNSKEKHAIPDQIINDCFEEYFKIGNAMKYKYKCYYDIYNSLYEDPINITLFDIFNDKMSIIETALVNEDASTNTNGRNFVCACVKKYKEMNDAYCLPGKRKSKDYTNTCKKLREFKDSYTWYLYNKHNLRDIIPSLDNIDQDLLAKCPKQQERSQLYSGARGTPVSSLGNGLPTGTVGQSHLLADDTNITPGNVDNPMKKTITTTIGTFAGASSLLAFLYKFTHAGRLVNHKLRRTTGMINNTFYGEEANGMLYDGNEHNGFNSYNIGYEAI